MSDKKINIEDSLSSAEKVIFSEYKGKMPFKVVSFAEKIGIGVYDFDDISEINDETGQNFTDNTISGMIIKMTNSSDSEYKIFTNTFANKSEKIGISRSIFTVAHELGHYFLHRSYLEEHKFLYNTFKDEKVSYTKDEKEREKEANNFAAELLMPDMLVAERWQEHKDKPDAVGILARYFNVSYLAMSFRVANVMNINSDDLLNLA